VKSGSAVDSFVESDVDEDRVEIDILVTFLFWGQIRETRALTELYMEGERTRYIKKRHYAYEAEHGHECVRCTSTLRIPSNPDEYESFTVVVDVTATKVEHSVCFGQ